MASVGRERLEQEIKSLLEQGDHSGAATLAIRGYGAEILRFLTAHHQDKEDAAEVFSLFSERLWRDLSSFQRSGSFRSWAYALARHASLNYLRGARRRAQWQQPLPEDTELLTNVESMSGSITSGLHLERQARLESLRKFLPPQDQALLMLRVDKELAWDELARMLHEHEQPLGPDELKREAARLRKRFQLLKERLLKLERHAADSH